MKTKLLTSVLATLILYLSSSFIYASFDIKDWDIEFRSICAFIWVCCLVILYIINFNFLNNEE